MTPAPSPRLPSWRPGPARAAVEAFLDAAPAIPGRDRLACFDNDGTLWCERPHYVQELFFFDALRRRVADRPELAEQPELAAVLGGDGGRVVALGLDRVVGALAALFAGVAPEEFAAEVASFVAGAHHTELDRPVVGTVYQPMRELISALRDLDFTVALVTGGGTEFVRAVSEDLYGVPPELVVGTPISYELDRDDSGRLRLRRGTALGGPANEGEAKVAAIQAQLGRRPVVAAGNSGGDREMLEWAAASPGPSLSLLVDHDDAARESAYVSQAVSFAEATPITEVARDAGWTVVSMARDWSTVFPDR